MMMLVHRHTVVQVLCTFAASIGGLMTGILLGWSSALPFLPSTPLAEEDIPLAASLINLGAFIFAIPGGKLADNVGRTAALLFFMTLFLVSFIVMAFTTTSYAIFGCRFVAGMGMGGACVVSNMYYVEIGERNLTAVLGGIFSIMVTLGLFLVNLLSLWCGWEEYHLIPAIFPLVYGLCYLVMPESPVYLMAKGKKEQARKCLELLRSRDEVDLEITYLGNLQGRASFTLLFTNKSNLRALLAGMGVHAFQQLSNINGFNSYADSLLKNAGLAVEPNICGIVVSSFQVFTSLPITFILEKRGRKFFLTLSAIIISICHLTLGVYYQLRSLNITSLMQYIPFIALMTFMLGFNLGVGPVTWILTGEMLPPNVRGYGGGFMVVTNWLISFVVTLCFPLLLDKVGDYGTFYGFACVGVAMVVFFRVVVPETKGIKYL